jgi:hypothetical protein
MRVVVRSHSIDDIESSDNLLNVVQIESIGSKPGLGKNLTVANGRESADEMNSKHSVVLLVGNVCLFLCSLLLKWYTYPYVRQTCRLQEATAKHMADGDLSILCTC